MPTQGRGDDDDNGDGGWRRSQRDSDNDVDVKEGRSHSSPPTTASRELAMRLCSAGIPYVL